MTFAQEEVAYPRPDSNTSKRIDDRAIADLSVLRYHAARMNESGETKAIRSRLFVNHSSFWNVTNCNYELGRCSQLRVFEQAIVAKNLDPI
jgi:hypothetical protein